MKKSTLLLLLLTTLIVSTTIFSSCEKIDLCEGKDTLSLTNTSNNTIQQINIDGASYGNIHPGSTKKIQLAEGIYDFQSIGLNNNTGCYEATVHITACETQTFSCEY